MPPSITELASRLNLSKGAVSRILNDKGEAFSEETRRRVLTLADEVGYRPHPVARALATGRTGFISLWVQDLLTAYHAHVTHQMEDRLERHGYQVTIALFGKAGRGREGDAAGAATPPTSAPVVVADGIIAHEIWGDFWPALLKPLASHLPTVTTGAWAPNDDVDYVGIDLGPASRAACEHFVRSGRRRVAYLTDQLGRHAGGRRFGDARFESFRSVMNESGLPEECIETGNGHRAVVRAAARAYFEEHGCPDAIFCHNDDAAIAAYRALCDLGRRVPDDVALIGCDGIEDMEYLETPLSTIVQPLGEMCEQAATFLERRLAEPGGPPQRTILQPELVLRESA